MNDHMDIFDEFCGFIPSSELTELENLPSLDFDTSTLTSNAPSLEPIASTAPLTEEVPIAFFSEALSSSNLEQSSSKPENDIEDIKRYVRKDFYNGTPNLIKR